MTNGEESTEITPEIQEIKPLDPIEYTFFEKVLRRVYLEDSPRLLGSIVTTGTSFPADPSTGQLFWRTDSGKFYLYDGTDWRQIIMAQADGTTRMPGRTVKE